VSELTKKRVARRGRNERQELGGDHMLTLMKRNVTPAMHSGSRRETGRYCDHTKPAFRQLFDHSFIHSFIIDV